MQVEIEDEIKAEIAEYLKDEAKRLQLPGAMRKHEAIGSLFGFLYLNSFELI